MSATSQKGNLIVSAEAYIYEAVRTPRGKGKKGALHGTKPLDLVVGLIDEVKQRLPQLDPAYVDDVVLGVVSPIGDQGGDIAKAAAIAAGLPDTVGGIQVNRFCASGLEATNIAAQKVRSGWDRLVFAGGVESMSRVGILSDGGPLFNDPVTTYDHYFVPQGIGADLIATIEGFSREDVDAYAVRSQDRADAAWRNGYFARSVVPVRDVNGVVILEHDEHRRPGSTVESLGGLKPSFEGLGRSGGFDAVALQKYHEVEKINHVHTGGNSSGIVDGASLLLIGGEQAGRELGLTPRGRVVATAISGADPTIMLTGPKPATEKVLATAGLTLDDIDIFELNEAFASVVLKWIGDLKIPEENVNVNGGAIAMGHPLGATGGMLVSTVLDELERREQRRGLITLCIGGGMGVATIIERV
ncbi:acetyl-CoA acetyltransferase [Candidatus Protofrankia datiscae]|uniref:Acetyl-CoA acetyltransferase n=1 Tax=Candidatus Protofrankia datiscae TaxID=2716812 RepID=F8AY68_9ACTN|nr:acetyl-CoA acetyltransferase [Candidatus Protofrankia datiscae]